MKFTGERMIPEHNKSSSIYLEHMARYYFASQLIKDKIVLDVACGSGYGTDIFLEARARKVIGVDISKESIEYCKEKYADKKNAEFIVGDVRKIPLEDNSVDVVVSFETIEHVDEGVQEKFLKEIKRVLRVDGELIMSTPNTLVAPKGNKFHLKELEPDEFHDTLKTEFFNIKMFYQDDIESSFIFSEKTMLEEGNFGNSGEASKIILKKTEVFESQESLFLIAVCSNQKNMDSKNNLSDNLTLSNLKLWRLCRRHESVVKLKDKEIKRKEKEIDFMKTSVFWKARKKYLKFKNLLGIGGEEHNIKKGERK